jgi:hypothetical protein
VTPFYENAIGFFNGLAPVKLGAKWGYIDRDANVRIPARYDMAGPFMTHRAHVTIDGKDVLIDRSGNIIATDPDTVSEALSDGVDAPGSGPARWRAPQGQEPEPHRPLLGWSDAEWNLGCETAPPVPETRQLRAGGIGLAYRPADFPTHSWKLAPRLTRQENGSDIPIGIAPAHLAIALAGHAPREGDNEIEIVPLRDPSVPNYAKAYPDLHRGAQAVARAIADPAHVDIDKIEALVDAEFSLLTRVEYLAGPAVEGFAYLAQYTQEDLPTPANNYNLTWVFVGLTRDRRYWVHASFAVGHPSLPRDYAATNSIPLDPAKNYLRQAERALAAFPATSFQPSLEHFAEIVLSISVDPAP